MLNKENHKISFCTVCMNRLHHLKKTLPENIKNNYTYPEVEFIVLDYNSQDGLSDWVYECMSPYIESGILKFYKTYQPKSFIHSHAKNAVSKLSTGHIICNIDADNYTGEKFAHYINNKFTNENNIYLYISKNTTKRDNLGRICMKSSDFRKLTGYDEKMVGYGFEDIDLVNRLELLGRKKVEINNSRFLNAIPHNDSERLKFEKNSMGIQGIYINQLTYKSLKILYLFNDFKYSLGTVRIPKLENSLKVDNFFRSKSNNPHEFVLSDNHWEKGEFKYFGERIRLKSKSRILSEIELNKDGDGVYQKINTKDSILSLKMFYSQISNRIKMEQNKKEGILKVNPDSFGEVQIA